MPLDAINSHFYCSSSLLGAFLSVACMKEELKNEAETTKSQVESLHERVSYLEAKVVNDSDAAQGNDGTLEGSLKQSEVSGAPKSNDTFESLHSDAASAVVELGKSVSELLQEQRDMEIVQVMADAKEKHEHTVTDLTAANGVCEVTAVVTEPETKSEDLAKQILVQKSAMANTGECFVIDHISTISC